MAKTTTINAIMIPLSSVSPDEKQPRKNFAPERMAELIASITEHGIINPIVVQKLSKGYLLIDGERRYRAAKEVGLKEVPAIIREPMSDIDRLIEQFHLQEQHEGWSAVEKAVAVSQLAAELKVSMIEVAKVLAIPDVTIRRYVAFGNIIDRENFVKNEVSLKYAAAIVHLRVYTKNQYEAQLKKEFTEDKQEKFERALIARIVNGEIKRTSDLTKVRDSIRADAAVADRLIRNSEVTATQLFLESKAEVHYEFRNLISAGLRVITHARSGAEHKGFNALFGDADILVLRNAQQAIDNLLGPASKK